METKLFACTICSYMAIVPIDDELKYWQCPNCEKICIKEDALGVRY